MLHDGKVQEFPDGRYRIIFDETPKPKGTVVFGPLIDELGKECIVDRPATMNAILKAKASGLRTVVCGYSNRHPFYQDADEYWGICVPMKNGSGWHAWYRPEMERALPGCKFANSDGQGYPGFFNQNIRKYSPLPKPSKAAMEKASEIIAKRPFVTICPRNVPHPHRNLYTWQDVVDGILKLGADVVSCTPSSNSFKPSGVRFLQDLVGINDLLDVELALHAMADCCVTTNTGAVGIMLYATAKAIVICGGTGSFYPGWDGMRDLLVKENGVKPTKLVVTEGLMLGNQGWCHFTFPDEKHKELARNMVKDVESVLKGIP